MEKNIIVVDEYGNKYGSTWSKRAKGLVKKGRAHFVDDKTLCLVRPSDKNQEDIIMSENKSMIEELEKATSEAKSLEEAGSAQKEALTVFDVMVKLDELRSDLSYIDNIVAQVRDSDEEKLSVLERIVRLREDTYRKLISFYEKVYDDVKPRAFNAERRAELILEVMEKLPAPVAGAPTPDYAALIERVSEAL